MRALVIGLFALAAAMLVNVTAWGFTKNPLAVKKRTHMHMAAGTQDAMKRVLFSKPPPGAKPGIVRPSGGGRR